VLNDLVRGLFFTLDIVPFIYPTCEPLSTFLGPYGAGLCGRPADQNNVITLHLTNCEYDFLFLIFSMFRYIMKVNSENMEDMIFLKSFSENLGGVCNGKGFPCDYPAFNPVTLD
jgi:hypothetical protein